MFHYVHDYINKNCNHIGGCCHKTTILQLFAGGPGVYFHNFSGKILGILSTQHYYEKRDNLLTQH